MLFWSNLPRLTGILLIFQASAACVDSQASNAVAKRMPEAEAGSGAPVVDAGALCSGGREPMPLMVVEYDGVPSSSYIPTQHQGRDGVLHFDTAVFKTLLTSDGDAGFVTDVARIPIGCSSWSADGYFGPNGKLPDVNGLPVIGSAGVDLLGAQPSLFDLRGRRWIRYPNTDDRASMKGAAVPRHEWNEGVVVIIAGFDGTPVRLVIDTGAGDSLWLGQAPRPGDLEIVTQDYLGRELRVYQSTVELEVGGIKRTLPILRAPSFPGVAEDFARRNIQGLLGLSSIEALFVDKSKGVLEIALAGK
jgi:hypothetical protein